MQKFATIAALAVGSNAFNNSPFQGEHLNADVIVEEDRSIHRMRSSSKASVNKYESIINKDVLKKSQIYGD